MHDEMRKYFSCTFSNVLLKSVTFKERRCICHKQCAKSALAESAFNFPQEGVAFLAQVYASVWTQAQKGNPRQLFEVESKSCFIVVHKDVADLTAVIT